MGILQSVKTLHNSGKLAIQGKAESMGEFSRNLKEHTVGKTGRRKREKRRRWRTSLN